MYIDITLKITPKIAEVAQGNESKALLGHLGTHFDAMNKEFPLEYLERNALVFDVSTVMERDIELSDIDISKVQKDMFIAFYTGFIEKEGYGSKAYFTQHPQLSNELIAALVKKDISILGIDFAGVRRGKEHTPTDQYCADNGIFIIENLCNLSEIIQQGSYFQAYTSPMNFANITGLPCRVIAKL
ncbi:kynurenine formamidase [Anaerotignum neopropionicum]|uniref:Kynurenine formamidase n=1 Tax=Anaerotignum neopropionicum TaxID=36847 RepID=A0A136WEW3_9FIRM|nr:cyclase family protein [Anaerotignum neopropionicum]KXL53031.1 kynurenine formamidase [Anaerotignum neopropionicum]